MVFISHMRLVFKSVVLTTVFGLLVNPLYAHSAAPVEPPIDSNNAKDVVRSETDHSNSSVRDFYEVLEDVVADFEYDIKNGQVSGLSDLSIRNIGVSENIPPSFKSHIELIVTERIIQNSKTRIVQCQPCRAKQAKISGDHLIVTSAEQNPAQLARLAKRHTIENFMDIAFSYQPSGLILSLNTVDAESGAIVWSRSYNSETSRAAAYRRGVDFSQIDEARQSGEYEPSILVRPTIYYFFERNIGSYTGTLGLGFRMVERYDNRKKEVGFELNYLIDSSQLVGATSDGSANLYAGFNVTLLFIHAWNLIRSLENYNQVRGNIFVGIGGTYTSGFLGGLVRVGYEWRLGKHWAVSTNLGYRPKATAFISGVEAGSVSGLEFGLGISALL